MTDGAGSVLGKTRARLSASDKLHIDGFLASERRVEPRLVDGRECTPT